MSQTISFPRFKMVNEKIIGVTKKLFGIRLYTEHNLSSNKGQLESEATQIFLI